MADAIMSEHAEASDCSLPAEDIPASRDARPTAQVGQTLAASQDGTDAGAPAPLTATPAPGAVVVLTPSRVRIDSRGCSRTPLRNG